ncbi:major facilitator superfamily domain-containing protein [Xylariaceae sp. FL1272]|nr:major facilitator superfamily domain-containing protein [Xylariaceae sp. FL1272]
MSRFSKSSDEEYEEGSDHEEGFSRLLMEDADMEADSTPKSSYEMLALTISLAGSDYLLNIGISPAVIASVWIIPPLCGAIFQPLFGILSDALMSKVGRREPLILLGGIGLIVALVTQAWSTTIATILDSSCTVYGPACLAKVVVSVFAVVLLYASAQAVQVGARAKMIDSCSVAQQLTVNTWASRVISLTSVFYYMLSYGLPSLRSVELRMQELASISVLAIIATIGMASIIGFQQPALHSASSGFSAKSLYKHKSYLQQLKEIVTVPMAKILAIQSLASFAWFPYLFYISRYITEKNGAPSVRLGPLALFLQSLVYVIASLVLPSFVRDTGNSTMDIPSMPKFQPIQIWRFSQAIYSICIASMVLTSSTWLILALAATTGVCWAVTMVIPYTMLTEEFLGAHEGGQRRPSHSGMFLGINNLSITVPQIIAGVLCTTIFSTAFDGHTDSLSEGIMASLAAGSVVSLLATALLMFM